MTKNYEDIQIRVIDAYGRSVVCTKSRKIRLGQKPISDDKMCWCVPTKTATSAGQVMFFCNEVSQEHGLLSGTSSLPQAMPAKRVNYVKWHQRQKNILQQLSLLKDI
ncbi:hypothetical protein [Caryophanon tenue]|uniref:Uncharacterized protein n=1 Tax=Caryophanon tenue TaxID=33978 RepID=A0A1C0YN27_9BACL|nr:hypothetical protein [Caryophanon tenue]OCS88553.1 hypothetical protein A6M13_01535 [Caryophanon tenue]